MTEITIVNGLIGGLIATIVMTAFMMLLGDDSPPPTAQFWADYIGDDAPDTYMMQGMVLHFIYGLGAGVGLAGIAIAAGFDTVTLIEAVGVGLGYGFVLFAIGAVFWMKLVLDIDADPQMVGMFLFFHLVYGLVLGAVLGVGLL